MTDDKRITGPADARRIEGRHPDDGLRDPTGKPGFPPGQPQAAVKAAGTSADAAEHRAAAHA